MLFSPKLVLKLILRENHQKPFVLTQPSRIMDFFNKISFFTELQTTALRLDSVIDI